MKQKTIDKLIVCLGALAAAIEKVQREALFGGMPKEIKQMQLAVLAAEQALREESEVPLPVIPPQPQPKVIA